MEAVKMVDTTIIGAILSDISVILQLYMKPTTREEINVDTAWHIIDIRRPVAC